MKNVEKLVTYHGLSPLVGIPVRTLRTLKYQGRIPHVTLGRRTVYFNPAHVAEALRRHEVREI